MSRCIRSCVLLILALAFAFPTNGINSPDINAKIKAIFIYNFSRYVVWPAPKSSGNFKIGVYGAYPELLRELESMAVSRKRGNQKFEIINYMNLDEIEITHILYINPEKSVDIQKLTERLNGRHTLMVTEHAGSLEKGADINLFYENNKQKMEISKDNITKRNLKVSVNLLTLAKKVK